VREHEPGRDNDIVADLTSVVVTMTNGQEASHQSPLGLIGGGVLFVVLSAVLFRWRRWFWLHSPEWLTKWHKSVPEEYEDGRTLYVFSGVVMPVIFFAFGLFIVIKGLLAL
jgi:hypothetical protein